jgi:hypothetical protein
MSKNEFEPSDIRTDFNSCFLRRIDQSVSAARVPALSDGPEVTDPIDLQFQDPERWDGLS